MSASIEQSHEVVCVFSRVRAGEISGEDNSIVPPCNSSRRGLTHLLLAKSIMGWRKRSIQGDSQLQRVMISGVVPAEILSSFELQSVLEEGLTTLIK